MKCEEDDEEDGDDEDGDDEDDDDDRSRRLPVISLLFVLCFDDL